MPHPSVLAAAVLLALAGASSAQGFSSPMTIGDAFFPHSVEAADLDGDGDLDVFGTRTGDPPKGSPPIGGIEPQLVWFENLGGGSFGPQKVIAFGASWYDDPLDAKAGDIDGDGDLDVACIWDEVDAVHWYANDGTGSFSSGTALPTAVDGGNRLVVADTDGDGPLDVLALEYASGRIHWFRGLGGGAFASSQLVADTGLKTTMLHAADLDGDGDLDVLSNPDEREVVWQASMGGGLFGSATTLASFPAGHWVPGIDTPDFDGDGDADVLIAVSTSWFGGVVQWLENSGAGTFGTATTMISPASHMKDVAAGDIDGDGDVDVAAATWPSGSWPLLYWQKQEPVGFGSIQTIANWQTNVADRVEDMELADLDGDGDLDVLVADIWVKRFAWCENVLLPYDCNGNGVPDVTDLASGTSQDCNGNLIPDECDASDPVLDCDGNGLVDSCELAAGALDCDGNGVLDACDVLAPGVDCDGNGLIDACELAAGAPDCNGNGVLDVCDLAHPWGIFDCDGNGLIDSCEIAGGAPDCNGNGVLDLCDLANGTSVDLDGNGIPDECLAPPLDATPLSISVAAGGVQTFTLTAPTANDLYFLLGTTSGTSPGTPEAGFVVPLNLDSYLLHTLLLPNAPPLSGAFGLLMPGPAGGTATATFTLPPSWSPTLVGLTLHHAFVVLDLPLGHMSFVSNPAPLELVP